MITSENGGSVTVLVVDDDRNIRLLVDEILEAEDRTLIYAHSGAEALRALRRTTPAVILLDVELGDMTGFEVANLCRDNPRLVNVPIVFITGHAFDDESMSAGYGLGAIDYLSKPIIPEILASKVTVLCTLAQQMKLIARQRDQLEAAQAELERANEELSTLAATDPLTGLANRRQFLDMLNLMCTRQIRTGGALAVAMLDLDGFKSVNDVHGHSAGDSVLVQASARLLAATRSQDVVGRLGGDEFAIGMGHFEDENAITQVTHRIRDVMREPYCLERGAEVTSPASIGVVRIRPESALSVDEILSIADAAMYQSKADPARAARIVDEHGDPHG